MLSVPHPVHHPNLDTYNVNKLQVAIVLDGDRMPWHLSSVVLALSKGTLFQITCLVAPPRPRSKVSPLRKVNAFLLSVLSLFEKIIVLASKRKWIATADTSAAALGGADSELFV